MPQIHSSSRNSFSSFSLYFLSSRRKKAKSYVSGIETAFAAAVAAFSIKCNFSSLLYATNIPTVYLYIKNLPQYRCLMSLNIANIFRSSRLKEECSMKAISLLLSCFNLI